MSELTQLMLFTNVAVQAWSMVKTTEMHAHLHRQTSAPVTYLKVLVLLTPSVQARPHLIWLICRHISMDGSFSRWRQGFVKNSGNGDDAHVLGCLQVLPVIDHQVMAIKVWIQAGCINACKARRRRVRCPQGLHNALCGRAQCTVTNRSGCVLPCAVV